jgi:hypothetical protein
LYIFLATFLFALLPVSAAFGQLAKPDGLSDGVTDPPHDRPLKNLNPCSQCHIRFDQWAESKFEIKKPAISSREDFRALRDLQYQLAQGMTIPCSGTCGKPTDYQIHPVRHQSCLLCHDKYAANHAGLDMAINEANPAQSCVGSGCHKDLKFLGDKIPYSTMAFAQVEETPDPAVLKLEDLFARTQSVAGNVFPTAPITALAKAEGVWKHEIKSRLGQLVNLDWVPVAEVLSGNLLTLTEAAYPAALPGALEGKVEVKTDVSNEDLLLYTLEFDRELRALDGLLKESVSEAKYKPAFLPIDTAKALFKAEFEKRFEGEVIKEEKPDKIVWTLEWEGKSAEVTGEFKDGESKFIFKNLPPNPSDGHITAVLVLSKVHKEYPASSVEEAKHSRTYAGTADNRWLIANSINDYAASLPGKEFRYELKGAKDTETAGEVAAVMPIKAAQHAEDKILKLKTELKVKYDKPNEPEVKAEAAAAEFE